MPFLRLPRPPATGLAGTVVADDASIGVESLAFAAAAIVRTDTSGLLADRGAGRRAGDDREEVSEEIEGGEKSGPAEAAAALAAAAAAAAAAATDACFQEKKKRKRKRKTKEINGYKSCTLPFSFLTGGG